MYILSAIHIYTNYDGLVGHVTELGSNIPFNSFGSADAGKSLSADQQCEQ